MSIGFILKIISAGFIGAASVRFLPESWIVPVVLTAFGTCIIMLWIVAFQSNAVDFRWFGRSGWPFKPFETIKESFFFRAFILLASFAIDTCVSLVLTAHT